MRSISAAQLGPNGVGSAPTVASTTAVSGGYIHMTVSGIAPVARISSAQKS